MRRVEVCATRADLNDLAVGHERDFACDFTDKAHLLADEQHGHFFAAQPADCVERLRHELPIRGGGDTIGQAEFQLQGDRPCNGNPLLLAV